MSIAAQLKALHDGTESALVCQVSSGWVVLCITQYLHGYCILIPDPLVVSLNDLTDSQRTLYLRDMVIVGDALLEVTDAYRINYALMGNSDQVLHAHIVPRFLTEPEQYLHDTPWSYPDEIINATLFDYASDKALIEKLSLAIRNRL